RFPSGPIYRYLICPYTSGPIGGCCACSKQGATISTTASSATYFATANITYFNIVTLSIKLKLDSADDIGGVIAGQWQRGPTRKLLLPCMPDGISIGSSSPRCRRAITKHSETCFR